jgi:lipopolysaccharide O-acetyltransferase
MKNNIIWNYSMPDLLRLIWSMIITKIFFTKVRIIRQPSRVRGYKNMMIGCGFTTGQYCRIEAGLSKINTKNNKSLIIGNHVEINDFCHIAAINSIVIGDNVLIASKVFIADHDHGETDLESLQISPSSRVLISSPVFIGDRVWIGEGAAILKGVTLGSGCVVGAGAIVTKSFPDNSIIVGVPGRRIN